MRPFFKSENGNNGLWHNTILLLLLMCFGVANAQPDSVKLTPASASPWTVPTGVTKALVKCWGGGASGGGGASNTSGGGGAAYADSGLIKVSGSIPFYVGRGAVGTTSATPVNGDSTNWNNNQIKAIGGKGIIGGAVISCIGSNIRKGGNGAAFGGGGSGGYTGAAGNATTLIVGRAGNGGGAAGRASSKNDTQVAPADAPGGGGGGYTVGPSTATRLGGDGGDGQILIFYPTITSLSATSGCGSSSLTINGINLTGAIFYGVTIGGVPVKSITSNTSTEMVVVPENGSSGVVSVTSSYGTYANAAFSYTSAAMNISQNITACQNYSWHSNTYSASGDYTYSYDNSGCTSVDTLHLTITSNTPDAPTNLVVTSINTGGMIAFTAPSEGGITNYEYNVNNSDTWSSASPIISSSPLIINSGLNNCINYEVKIRAVNICGGGTASSTVILKPLVSDLLGINWKTSDTIPVNSWNSVAYGNGFFVAVSVTTVGTNKVIKSADGITWTSALTGKENQWYSVTYGNGLFVVVAGTGTGNRVMTSTNGIDWTSRASAADNVWYSVTYGNGLFVAVAISGIGNRVMTSTNGIDWTLRASAADNVWSSVTYGNGLFVAVAQNGTGNRVMTSTNGIDWTLRASAADNQWNSVTYGNGLFVAVANTGTGNRVMTSPNGIDWTSRASATENRWTSVTHGNGLFVAVSNANGIVPVVMTSPDGLVWTSRASAITNWNSVTYGNGLFVAVSSISTRLLTSSFSVVADAPVITSAPVSGTVATVAFTQTASQLAPAIVRYDYSTNNGISWDSVPAVITSPLTINLPSATSTIMLRAVNSVGVSCPSNNYSNCLPNTGDTTAFACGSFVWYGNTYTSSASPTHVFTNSGGCDSLVTLHLTINQPTTSTSTVTAIGSYTWNGTTYYNNGAYTYQTSSSNGCDSTATLNLTIGINNITNVCTYIGTNQTLTYTASVAGASSYAWTLPSNTQLVSGQGTRSIVIKVLNGFASQANKQIRVTPAGGSLQIIYLSAQAPSTPSTIVASSSNVCTVIGTSGSITYTIPKAYAAASYIWTAQANTTSISHLNAAGENDTTVTVTFSSAFTSSNITVQSVNTCGASGTRSLTIAKNNPSTPGLISGPANACEYIGVAGAIATYSVGAAAGVNSYDWTVPANAINVTGQGTRSISFKYPAGFASGTISVTATNGCGTSGSRLLTISRLNPSMPGQIDVINTTTCPDRVYSYTISSMPAQATSLLWAVPAGATLLSGQGTTSISVSYPLTTINGLVTVKSVSNCGVSSTRTITIKLGACPPSDPLTKGIEMAEPTAPADMKVSVYPNPSVNDFNLRVITADRELITVRVLDVQGRLVKEIKVAPYQTINFGAELKAGVYIIEVRQGKAVKMERVVKF